MKADENLEMTALALAEKKYNVCASRAYYAVFRAGIAALLKLTSVRARDNEWPHSQVQAELNRELIMRRKVLPADVGRTPMDLMELRHLADYKSQSVSATEARRRLSGRSASYMSSERHCTKSMSKKTDTERSESDGAKEALSQYLRALEDAYPAAKGKTGIVVRPDNRIIVSVPLPKRIKERMQLFDRMAEVATELLLQTDQYIVLSAR